VLTFAFTIGVLATASLGLCAGAVLAEACVLVPFWRSQDPASFLDWYRRNAERLLRFYGPLEATSGVLVLVATALAWLGHLPGAALFSVSAALTVAVLASFPFYFKNANASFASGSIPVARVAAELARWAAWHWARTAAATAAFLLAVLGLAG
jgi:hypothetical protein